MYAAQFLEVSRWGWRTTVYSPEGSCVLEYKYMTDKPGFTCK